MSAFRVSLAALALAPLAFASISASGTAPAAAPETSEKLAAALAAANTPDSARELRERLRAEKPSAALVALLADDRLAVRLGALESLEDLAGNDFAFDAWLPPGAPENTEPLARWKSWAATGKAGAPRATKEDEAMLRGLLNDTLGDDEPRRERALRMMLRRGLPALKVLENHRATHPDLSDAAKARLAEARYALALHESGSPAARTLARDLAFGSRDRRLEALGALRAAGPGALPVAGEFLDAPEPLVRETAVEVFMALGGEATHETVAGLVAKESDVNVLHAVLRALGEKRSEKGNEIARGLLSHADEEIVCGALECLFPKESGSGNGGAIPEETLTRVRSLAADARWRLRAAAMETIARLKLSKESALIAKGLEDPDPFVRAAAITASVESRSRDMIGRLEKLADTDDDTQMPAVRALKSFGRPVPESLASRIPAMPRERILSWLTASQGVQEERVYPPRATLLTLARSSDTDIARAALLTLMERHGKDAETLLLAEAALASAKPEELPVIIAKMPLVSRGKSSEKTEIESVEPEAASSAEVDGFFAALGGAKAKPTAPATKAAATAPAGPSKSAEEILKPILRHASPAVRRAAQLRFAAAGDPEALAQTAAVWSAIEPDERLSISEKLEIADNADGAGVLRALLRDPLPAVRRNALNHIEHDAGKLRRAAFEACLENDSPLTPAEVLEPLQWRLEYTDRKSGWPDELGRRLLAPGMPADRKVLGLILASGALSRMPEAELNTWTGHSEPLVRRAAWFSLATRSPLRASRAIGRIADDPEACVRAVAARLALPDSTPWEHRFTPSSSVSRQSSYSSEKSAPITKTMPPVLERLLDDPDAAVRFDAALALINIGRSVDTARFGDIFRAQTDAAAARRRIAGILNASAESMPPATLRRLAGFLNLTELDNGARKLVAQASGDAGGRAEAPLTFARLVALELAPDVIEGAKPPAGNPDAKPAAPEKTARTPLVFFVKPGCRECDRVDSLLKALCAGDPGLTVLRRNITETDGLLLNRRLSDLRRVPLKETGRTPAVFGRDGWLTGDAITGPALEKLLADSRRAGGDDTWTVLPESERAGVAARVQSAYAGLSMAVILGAGLLDGVNPCAFATLIFLISYLRVARRSPREILMVGGAFVSAVYLTYFAIGLGLHGALGALAGLSGLRGAVNLGFALLAGVLALLSIRDGVLARSGRLREMNLQLPGFLKERIRGVIREGAKARRFVLFAFVSGALISLLELACTGQVYAPIVNQIRQGSLNAVGALAAYNAAFVAPLLLVFALAYGGLQSESLIRFQQRHTATVRFATAALFLTLAGLLLYAEWRARSGA